MAGSPVTSGQKLHPPLEIEHFPYSVAPGLAGSPRTGLRQVVDHTPCVAKAESEEQQRVCISHKHSLCGFMGSVIFNQADWICDFISAS